MSTQVTIGDITCNAGPDDFGVIWTCKTPLQGWGSPGGTLVVTQRQQDHGGQGGSSFLKPRVLAVSGLIIAPDQATARDALDRLCVAASLDATTLVVSEAGLSRQCAVRRQDDVLPTWETDQIVSWSVQLIAEDPRRYATDLISLSTGLPSSSGGLTWPISWPAALTALNANPFFESTASPWTALTGTVARSTAQAHEGTASLLLTPDGTSSSAEARSENVPVTAGVTYIARGWLRCAVARSVNLDILWRDASNTLLSTSVQTVSVAANTWTFATVIAAAPAGATQAQIAVNMSSTPPSSNLLWIDEAMLGATFTGGITWPAVVTSGVMGVDLAGNMPTRPRFVITGPCSTPVITLVGTGHVLSWDLDLVAGQYLDVDVDRRTSLLNGQVSRSGSMTSRDWFDLQPGHSDIAFNAAAFDSNARLTVTCRSAWL